MGLCEVIGDFSVDNSNYNRLKSEKFVNSKLKINIKRKKKIWTKFNSQSMYNSQQPSNLTNQPSHNPPVAGFQFVQEWVQRKCKTHPHGIWSRQWEMLSQEYVNKRFPLIFFLGGTVPNRMLWLLGAEDRLPRTITEMKT